MQSHVAVYSWTCSVVKASTSNGDPTECHGLDGVFAKHACMHDAGVWAPHEEMLPFTVELNLHHQKKRAQLAMQVGQTYAVMRGSKQSLCSSSNFRSTATHQNIYGYLLCPSM